MQGFFFKRGTSKEGADGKFAALTVFSRNRKSTVGKKKIVNFVSDNLSNALLLSLSLPKFCDEQQKCIHFVELIDDLKGNNIVSNSKI